MKSLQLILISISITLLMVGCNRNDAYARSFGGPRCRPSAICTDSSGNIYITGNFIGGDLDPGAGVVNSGYFGIGIVFLIKLDASGEYQWGQFWDCTFAYDLVVDEYDNVYVTGSFHGTVDFDPGPNYVVHSVPNQYEFANYLASFNSDGQFRGVQWWPGPDRFRFRGLLEMVQTKYEFDLALDNSGNIYFAGIANPIRKFDTGGNSEILEDIDGNFIDIDQDGNIYTTGFYSEEWELHMGEPEVEPPIFGQYAFISKYSVNYEEIWKHELCDNKGENISVFGLSLDDQDGIYILGQYEGSVEFNPGPDAVLRSGDHEVFLIKFNAEGEFQWVNTWFDGKILRGMYDDRCEFALDGSGNAYISGTCKKRLELNSSTNNNIQIFDVPFYFDPSAYLMSINSDGEIQWIHYWGEGGNIVPSGITVDDSGDILLTGNFGDILDLDPGPKFVEFSDSDNTGFIFRINEDGSM